MLEKKALSRVTDFMNDPLRGLFFLVLAACVHSMQKIFRIFQKKNKKRKVQVQVTTVRGDTGLPLHTRTTPHLCVRPCTVIAPSSDGHISTALCIAAATLKVSLW